MNITLTLTLESKEAPLAQISRKFSAHKLPEAENREFPVLQYTFWLSLLSVYVKDGSHNQGLFAHLYILYLVGKGLIFREYGPSKDLSQH